MKEMKRAQVGFTLIEILVAVLIFAILSLLMTEGLGRMISFNEATVQRAATLRELQLTFLILTRDLEQAVNRKSVNASGQKEAAFIGTPEMLTFTHGGQASVLLNGAESQLQRVSYSASGTHFVRGSVAALDVTSKTPLATRSLSANMEEIRFQYYSRKNKRFYDNWPLKDAEKEALPSAIRMYVTISYLGKMSQLYVIPQGY